MLSQMILSVISMTVKFGKRLMSLRTKEGLQLKTRWYCFRKTKGTIQKSKFDEQIEKIEELLSVGLSVRKIANFWVTTIT